MKKHEGEEAAAGAVAGSIGLIAFGALVWALAARLARGSWSLLLPGRSSPCAEARVGLMCPCHRAIKA